MAEQTPFSYHAPVHAPSAVEHAFECNFFGTPGTQCYRETHATRRVALRHQALAGPKAKLREGVLASTGPPALS